MAQPSCLPHMRSHGGCWIVLMDLECMQSAHKPDICDFNHKALRTSMIMGYDISAFGREGPERRERPGASAFGAPGSTRWQPWLYSARTHREGSPGSWIPALAAPLVTRGPRLTRRSPGDRIYPLRSLVHHLGQNGVAPEGTWEDTSHCVPILPLSPLIRCSHCPWDFALGLRDPGARPHQSLVGKRTPLVAMQHQAAAERCLHRPVMLRSVLYGSTPLNVVYA